MIMKIVTIISDDGDDGDVDGENKGDYGVVDDNADDDGMVTVVMTVVKNYFIGLLKDGSKDTRVKLKYSHELTFKVPEPTLTNDEYNLLFDCSIFETCCM